MAGKEGSETMNSTIGTRGAHDWWNTVSPGVAAAAVFLLFWFNACSTASPNADKGKSSAAGTNTAQMPNQASKAATAKDIVPQSLADAGEYGENVYDYAKASDWKNANAKVAALKDSATRARAEVKNQSAAVDRLDKSVDAVAGAVLSKDRQAAMREANQVTLDVANMTTPYKLSVPAEVTKLDYFGRELEVWAQVKEATKLQATARDMRQTWDALRPGIEAHSVTEARKFDALVARAEAAKTPADYGRLATLILNEVDNLEKLFH